MPAAAFPPDEDQRLEVLRSYQILDTPAESAFDDLTLLASKICGTPISLVSLIDRDRQWFKSKLGLGASETHRDFAFCSHAILQADPFVIPDAQADDRFCDNPLVTGEPHVRFYAAAPLISPEGYPLGTLCVIDHIPRQLSAYQLEMLAAIGRQVVSQLELRRTVAALAQEVGQRRQVEQTLQHTEAEYRSIFENAVEGIYQTSPDGRYLRVNPMLAQIYGYESAAQLIGAVQNIQQQLYVRPDRRDEFRRLVQQNGSLSGFESQIYRKDDRVIWISENARPIHDATGQLVGYEGSVTDITDRKRNEQRLETQYAITQILAESQSMAEAAAQILQVTCTALEWEVGELWQCAPDETDRLHCVQIWHLPTLPLEEFAAVTRQMTFDFGVGLPGQVWQRAEPAWISDMDQDQSFLRSAIAAQAGLRAGFGFPILHAGQVLGVFTFLSRQVQPLDQPLLKMLTAIGEQMGQFIQRKQTEVALQESQARFRSAFDDAAIGMALVSLEGEWLQVNPSFCEMVGYSEAELVGRSFREITHPADLKIHAELVPGLLLGHDRFYQVEKRYLHKQGHSIWSLLNVSLVRNSTGAPSYFVSQIQDITHQKQAAAALQNSEYRFRTLSRFAPVGIFLTDAAGRCTYVNDRWGALMGLSFKAALGLGWIKALHPLDRDRITATWNDSVKARAEFSQEFRALTTDGTINWVIGRATPLWDSTGRVTGFIGTTSDITSLKQAEQERQESETAIRALYEVTASQTVSSDDRFQQLLQLGCRQFGLLHGFLVRIEGSRCEVISAQSFNSSLSVGAMMDIRQVHCLEVLDAAEPVCLENAKGSGCCDLPDSAELQMETFIGMRVLMAQKIYGVLYFCSSQSPPKPFKTVDKELLKLMAQWIGGELERQQAAIVLQRQLDRASLLERITCEIRQSLDTAQIFQTTAAQIGQAFQANRCLIHTYLPTPTPQIPVMAEYREPGYESILDLHVPVRGNPPVEKLLAQDQAIASPRVHRDPLLLSARSINPEITIRQAGLKSMLAVRTSYQGQPNGIIAIHHYSTYRDWTAEEIELLESVANQVGIALAQASLLEQEKYQRQKLTEQNLALEQSRRSADQSNRAKGDFLATMSHEIRTPMNAVIGMTGLLLDTTLSAPQRDFVETIRSSGDALLTIINDILDFSKIESGKLELEEQPFHLGTCVEEVLDLLASKAAEKGLELAYLTDPKAPTHLLGDVTRLRQILVNLVGNAIKFTETGEVVVSVQARSTPQIPGYPQSPVYKLQFAVRDTGIGIPQEKRERLFKAFSQVDSSITRQYGGTGLGLVISRRLSELMGGKMWLESQPGQGSTFYFTIVVPAATADPRSLIDPATLFNKRLLIVDDSATNRQILTLQSQAWKMRSQAVGSGMEALMLLAQGAEFDLAILDMQMPGMDGLTLATEIRKLPQGKILPLVMLTSLGRYEAKLQEHPPNFAAFLTKPIKQSHLHNAIAQIFGEKLNQNPAASTAMTVDFQLGEKLPLRILLAEDHPVNQKMALMMLQRLGYRADVAGNGIEVLEALQRQPYDVVLMDVQMPEMDGLEATRSICQRWTIDRPRIIAMTANAMQGDREECLNAGMDDYVSKPVRMQELAFALSQCQPRSQIANSDPEIPVFDRSVLQTFQAAMGEASDALVVELIDCYLDDTPRLLETLTAAIDQQNFVEWGRAAHSLKSSSAALGALSLAEICKKLEEEAVYQDLTRNPAIGDRLTAEYARVKVALEQEKLRIQSTASA